MPATGLKWRFVLSEDEEGNVSGDLETGTPMSTYALARHLILVASYYLKSPPRQAQPAAAPVEEPAPPEPSAA